MIETLGERFGHRYVLNAPAGDSIECECYREASTRELALLVETQIVKIQTFEIGIGSAGRCFEGL